MTLRQRLSAVLIALVAVLAVSVAAAGTATAAPSTGEATPQVSAAALTTPVTGTYPGGTFAGTFTLTNFVAQNGQLLAAGTLTGTLTDTAGNVVGTVTQVPVQLPVTIQATCQILHLELGPLDLNLLGLTVHLNRIVLDITAQSGPGNLLGSLLCAIAHLLGQNPPASTLAAILNQILALLG